MPKILLDTITVNKRGQLVLPISIRRQMNIQDGGKLNFSFDQKNQFTILKPVQATSFVEKWAGIIDDKNSINTKQYLLQSRKLESKKDQKLNSNG